MTLHVLAHPRVKADFAQAIHHYDRRLPGLGKAVIGQTARLLDRIRRYPRAFPRVRFDVRRAGIPGLDAELLYSHDDHRVVLLALTQERERHP